MLSYLRKEVIVINDRIRQVRKEKGLNRQQFAEKLNLSSSTIESYELGRLNPSKRAFTDICRVFHVSPKWLNTGEGEMFVEQDKHDRLSSWIAEISLEEDSDRRRIVEALTTLTEEQWSLLADIAKKIVGGD
jgi:transcriptional regulator with XRE-family HTH domain